MTLAVPFLFVSTAQLMWSPEARAFACEMNKFANVCDKYPGPPCRKKNAAKGAEISMRPVIPYSIDM